MGDFSSKLVPLFFFTPLNGGMIRIFLLKGVQPQYPTMINKLLFLSFAFLNACTNICDPVAMPNTNPQTSKIIKKKDTFPPSALRSDHFVTFDGDHLDYRKWLPSNTVKRVLVCTHGICGIDNDFDGLAKFLLSKDKNTALYAYNTRSQGHDPVKNRRGDIADVTEWYRDLERFSSLIRKDHPEAEIIWFGESMGSMITLNSYAFWITKNNGVAPCDRLILSAPVINLRSQMKPWQEFALTLGNGIHPSYRVSLNTLAGGHAKEITNGVNHDEATNNPYYVDSFTLRFLKKFGMEVDKMQHSICKVHSPVAIFHGGNDFFSGKQSVEAFLQKSPTHTPSDLYHYPNAYHLMLYDDEREKIFADILNWLNKEPTK